MESRVLRVERCGTRCAGHGFGELWSWELVE